MTEDTTSAYIDNQNIASDNAHVDQQIGVQNVESVYHNATIYTVSESDTAERKHEVALAYLTGGVPRRAEDLFSALVFNDHQSTERTYYYVLSVLSERGFGDLTAELVTSIRDTWKICASLPEDDWTRAHHVVRSLLDHVQSNNGDGSFTAVTAFGGLPAERQDEISRHLSLLVGGVVEQRLDVERKHKVGAERFSRNRIERARKFFEPDPAAPTRYQPRMALPNFNDRRSAVIGGLIAVLAFGGLFFGQMTLPFWGGVLLLAAGCSVMARYGIEHTAHLLHAARRRDAADPEDKWGGPTPVDKLIERCFRDARPEYAPDWPRYAAGYRARLKERFNAQLRYRDQPVNQLKWLFDWHAQRVAQRWPYHDPHVQPEPAARGDARRWQAAGVLVTVAGLALLLVAQRWQVVPLAVGGWFALPALLEVIAARRAALLPIKQADALFAEEMAEYRRWLEELADRPTDSELARWLALDKAHLKAEALRGGNIAEQDLVSHVVINHHAPGARRGAVPHGPPRYTAYLVTVILLTRYGIRASRVYLNFTTGEVKNENWDVFGYDRIASASLRMLEKTVRKGPGEPGHKVRYREFRLRLLDGAEIIKVNERLDSESDTEVDDEAELERLAAATSGMDTALPVLEAVAHQGRAWIDLERGRRDLWSRTWSD
ncbi:MULTISPECIES: hypothetical protein [unclassified Crossiella]|uniref:hypothetical protein n=1 Tax=unclassified Crossiella TaxID=2620835 RepID=UPI001FFF312F|nr:MULTISPECIES: hypothetical protein [unclassified Crossiella]MCK2237402.1 hypothetical protein [Crossiella sp. S99.2]MCK2251057.1 hypothetical protein [Crossiella sp. S99.1]